MTFCLTSIPKHKISSFLTTWWWRYCLCACVRVCLLHSVIFAICLETRKRPVIPLAFCYWKVMHWCCSDRSRQKYRDFALAGEKNGHITHTRVSEGAAETISGGYKWSEGWQLLWNLLQSSPHLSLLGMTGMLRCKSGDKHGPQWLNYTLH